MYHRIPSVAPSPSVTPAQIYPSVALTIKVIGSHAARRYSRFVLKILTLSGRRTRLAEKAYRAESVKSRGDTQSMTIAQNPIYSEIHVRAHALRLDETGLRERKFHSYIQADLLSVKEIILRSGINETNINNDNKFFSVFLLSRKILFSRKSVLKIADPSGKRALGMQLGLLTQQILLQRISRLSVFWITLD